MASEDPIPDVPPSPPRRRWSRLWLAVIAAGIALASLCVAIVLQPEAPPGGAAWEGGWDGAWEMDPGARRAVQRALARQSIDVREYKVVVFQEGDHYMLALHPRGAGEWASGYHVSVKRVSYEVTIEAYP